MTRSGQTAGVARPLNGRRDARGGFSLLEVILALTILTGAIAVLGELARLGARNAADTRDMTQAQLLCESKLAQFTSGMVLPENVVGVPFESADLIDPNDSMLWVYSVKVDSTEEDGLMQVTVMVSQDIPLSQHPVQCTLVRWMPNPGIEVSDQPSAESDESQSSSPKDVGTTEAGTGGTQ